MTALYAALFGLVFGSFASACAARIPRGESLGGRSHCDACHKTLSPQELIPVVSWLLLRGRCAGCAAPIGAGTPIIEIGCAAAFAAAFALLPAVAALIVAAIVMAIVIGAGVAVEKRSLNA
jgi:leader peptidase (prepilin peptidase)/N-methyltransferase